MVGFFIDIAKLFSVIWHSIKNDQDFRILLALLLTVLIGGTYFYWHEEGWSVIDALYFCVMTMSTIGYGDLAPSTSLSKLFTIVYSILSIGLFAAIVAKMVIEIVSRKKAAKGHKKHIAHTDSDGSDS